MAAERDDVRRVGIGSGIFVRIPATAPDGPGLPPAPPPPASRRVPRAALLGGGALAAGALLRLGTNPHGLLAAGLLATLAALAAVDVRARVLPNRIIGPALLAVLAWQLAFFGDRWSEWLLAGLGAGALFLLPSLVRPGAIGMGDVKLAVLLGVALGADVVSALTIGCLSAVPAALYLLARRGGARGASIPYGPFLALGAAAVLLA
jgi:leader peptidase (prepilin peptidase)/N-methyltransferase